MSSSGGAMLTKEEENEAEVRREDQENINAFGRLNARLQEMKVEQASLKVGKNEKTQASNSTPLLVTLHTFLDLCKSFVSINLTNGSFFFSS